MPLNVQKNLPAVELLKNEHISVIDTMRAASDGFRPLHIVVLNLMPLKITTETDLVRLLSNTSLQVEIDWMKIKGHTHKNTPAEHIKAFYKDFDDLKMGYYDGMIITGAPVEQMPFEEVTYWNEITGIFDWARTHVTSTLIYVGLPKQACTTSLMSRSMIWIIRCSVYSLTTYCILSSLYSGDLMMNFMCLIVGIRKCAGKISFVCLN